jgi:RNA polymerase sigma factor (sigma-70 family)
MTKPGVPEGADAPGEPQVGPAEDSPAGQVPGKEAPASEGEFAAFYREHFGRLVAYLVYQGAKVSLAADLAQDAMITAYRRWAELTSPRAYVWKVAGRAFIRHVVDGPELAVGQVPEPDGVLQRPGDAEAWVQEQQVISVLRALPPRQCQVLALTIDGWAPAEIAEMLGIDPAAVRSSLMKARRNADEHHRRLVEGAP